MTNIPDTRDEVRTQLDRADQAKDAGYIFGSILVAMSHLTDAVAKLADGDAEKQPRCGLYTDRQGRTWHIMERESGSISIYYTVQTDSCHWVVWESPTPKSV